MKSIFIGLILFTFAVSSQAITLSWTNTLGGDWSVTNNWYPHALPQAGDTAYITNNGTYTVTILSNTPTVGLLTLGGSSGTQTLLNGSANTLTMTNFGLVRVNGVLTITNAGGIAGRLSVATGGVLNLNSGPNIFFYNLALTNQGTVNWLGGYIHVGGNNSDTTYITNSGLWKMTSNDTMAWGGGVTPVFYNAGTVTKTAGTGNSQFSTMQFINLPSGVVSVTSGTFQLFASGTNYIGGSFTTTSPGAISFFGGTLTDAGGSFTGTGTAQYTGGNLYLRTNTIPGLLVPNGDIYLNTNTFQQAGAITNLTMDGTSLHGTVRVAGTLTFNSGDLENNVTVLPSGQLLLATAGSKLIYGLNLINQGTVTWSGSGYLNVGGSPVTTISNGGSWLMTGDGNTSNGAGGQPTITNSGTIRKSAGTGTSTLAPFAIVNQPGALIQVDSGTIVLSYGYTNLAGTLRLNGGQFQASSGVTLAGGTLDGSGNVAQNAFIGGTISPGQGGPGAMGFPAGLTFGSNATLVIDGTSASQYDQLTVTGAVSLAGCTLQIGSLPTVPFGTTFMIITNDGSDAISGTFKNLPENSLITVGSQLFKIHYAGGNGNDVTLVRDNGASGTTLAAGHFSNGQFTFTGSGFNSTVFTIQATTNFITWTNIGTATSDVGGALSFTDTNAPKFHYRYYRTTN